MDAETAWTTLGALRAGALFETQDGIRGVKSQYTNEFGDLLVVLLQSGEYGAGALANRATLVRELAELDRTRLDAGQLVIAPGAISSPFFCGAESCMQQQFYAPGMAMVCRSGHRGAPSKHIEGGEADPVGWALALEQSNRRLCIMLGWRARP